jgi:hypothetical protein
MLTFLLCPSDFLSTANTEEEEAGEEEAGEEEAGEEEAGEEEAGEEKKEEKEDQEEQEQEEECAVCLKVLVDPLAPCAEQPSHRYCRTCVQKLHIWKYVTCPMCRGKLQDAEALYCQAAQMGTIAKKAKSSAHRDELYANVFSLLHQALRVDSSFSFAQHNLGYMYANGEGVAQDSEQAAVWYRKAAEQGYTQAQCNLARMYQEGKGVEQDTAQAEAWFEKAAEQGVTRAYLELGYLSEIAGDYKAAIVRYRAGQAADTKYALAAVRGCVEQMVDSTEIEQMVDSTEILL